MQVWIFNAPCEEAVDFVSKSLNEGISRFGWSYIDSADLAILKDKKWDEMDAEEQMCFSKTQFLLEIEKGDWVVHINVPEWGKCTAGMVNETYRFDSNQTECGDFRHLLGLDADTIISFDRNDPNIHPYISRRLKLMGAHWRIYDTDLFLQSIDDVKKDIVHLGEGVTKGLYHLKLAMKPHLADITKSIHKCHPAKSLEEFFGMIFEKIPNVIKVKMNGSRYGTDYGADLIVEYFSGLPIEGLQEKKTLVIQVKSYEWTHYDVDAVEQIQTALKQYDAHAGLIISTADIASDELRKAIETVENETGKPIGLICGEDVATFVLKYSSGYIL